MSPQNPKSPEPLPAAMPRYEKTTSYSPPQYNRLRSTGGPEKSWGGGSYDKDGYGCMGRKPGYGGSPRMGRHTTGDR